MFFAITDVEPNTVPSTAMSFFTTSVPVSTAVPFVLMTRSVVSAFLTSSTKSAARLVEICRLPSLVMSSLSMPLC